MLSPKKGLLCNLNHIHLQHISLGLHLSRRPELQEGPVTMAPGDQTGCSDCQEKNCGAPEEVDANSNNTSLQCRCCKSHPQQQTLTVDLQNQPTLQDFLALHIEEEMSSPSDPASSSVSSCSDFSLDDTPVSVYCKDFPSEEALSPDNQPNIIPLEDAHSVPSLTDMGEISDGRDSNLNPLVHERPDPRAQESPDSLCSSSLIDSPSDDTDSPSVDIQETLRELLPPNISAKLDSNCNALPGLSSEPSELSVLARGLLDSSLNSAPQLQHHLVNAPPPVPPRAKRGLQVLNRNEVEKPLPAEVPTEPACRLGDMGRDIPRKNITSFHELAQKRRRNTAGPPPPQAKKDRSDWLIVFSPDKEMPPPNELTCCSTLCPELSDEQAKPPSYSQREVTTFKELRYRNAINKQKSQLAWELGEKVTSQEQPEAQQAAMDRDVSNGNRLQGSDWVSAPQLDGRLLALIESHQPRRKSRPGLQPIAEGLLGDTEEEGKPLEGYVLRKKKPESGCEEAALGWRLTGPDGDPRVSGKVKRGDMPCKEAGSPLSCCPRPQMLPFQPLLFHFSADGKPLYYSSDPVAPPLPLVPSLNSSLESIELKSPVLFTPAFRPKLKTLSCDEVCLLANNKGRVLGTLSPDELLPIRLSPIGAYSPPHRGALPFLDSSDLSVLFSPLFPRSRTFPTMAFPTHQVPELPFSVEISSAHCPRGEAGAHRQAGAHSGLVSPERKQSCCGPRGSRGAKNPRPPKQLRHSQSFAGVPRTGQHWMANADRAYGHLREQKKALLVAVSASVEKIIAHFSTARNLVQKAQLGDSRLSPDVSYLLLDTLCPALYALVEDGLKPFQKDIITGQRRRSPWNVVEASVKLGPRTGPLHSLYWQVSRLAPLSSNRQRFHAFVLGLLNIKQLELWLSHLQKSSGIISVLYLPTAFFSLSQGLFPHLASELLLLVQPLSVLSFHLDLLFEHHHLAVDVRPLPASCHTFCPALAASPAQGGHLNDQAEETVQDGMVGAGPEHELSPEGQERAALVGSKESAKPQCRAGATKLPSSPQAGVSLKQTWHQVLQWGDQLTQTFLGAEGPSESPVPEKPPQSVPQDAGAVGDSWWRQLSQTSGIDHTATKERFPFARWMKLRMAAGEASPGLDAPLYESSQASANEPGAGAGEETSSTDLQLLKPRAGEVVAKTSGLKTSNKAGSLRAPCAEELSLQASAKVCTGPIETEPPAGKRCLPPSQEPGTDGSLNAGSSSIRSGWLGRLFGATCPSARGFPADPDTSAAKSRRPSSWLPPSMNVLALVLKGVSSEKSWPQEQPQENVSDSAQLHRAVRALCDHTGAGDDHLSFRKGDVLQLLSTVDEDWIRCCHGNNTGLVPVGYTSLIL